MSRSFPILASVVLSMLCVGHLAWSQEHHEPASSEAAHGADGHGESGHGDHGDHAHTEGEHDEHGHGEHEAETLFNSLSFWGFIAFIGFCVAIVKLGLWDTMVTSMTEREQAALATLQDAQGKLDEARASLTSYRGQIEAMDETIRETLAEAGRDAEQTQRDILNVAEREANAAVERAEHQIGVVKDQSLLEIFTSLSEKVAEATEQAVRERMSDADQDRLIDETLQQIALN